MDEDVAGTINVNKLGDAVRRQPAIYDASLMNQIDRAARRIRRTEDGTDWEELQYCCAYPPFSANGRETVRRSGVTIKFIVEDLQ